MINLNDITYIEENGTKKAVIISYNKFLEIEERLEELDDKDAYEVSKLKDEETFPIELVKRCIAESDLKIKIYRQYRGLTLTELATRVGISEAYLSQIENRKRQGSIDLFQSLAKELKVDIEMLIENKINRRPNK